MNGREAQIQPFQFLLVGVQNCAGSVEDVIYPGGFRDAESERVVDLQLALRNSSRMTLRSVASSIGLFCFRNVRKA